MASLQLMNETLISKRSAGITDCGAGCGAGVGAAGGGGRAVGKVTGAEASAGVQQQHFAATGFGGALCFGLQGSATPCLVACVAGLLILTRGYYSESFAPCRAEGPMPMTALQFQTTVLPGHRTKVDGLWAYRPLAPRNG